MASYEVDEIILEGWFKKHSAKGKKLKKPLGKKAKRRWFCLTERYLDYYTAPRTKRKGTIPVDQLYIRRHDPYTLVVGSYGGKEMKITYDGSNNPAGKTDEWYQGIQDASEAAKLKYGKGGKKKPAQNQNASGNTGGQGSGDGALVEYVAPEQLEEGVIKCGKCSNEIEVDPGTGPVVRCPYCHEVVSSLTGIVAPPEPQQQPQQQRQMQQAPQQQQAPPPQQQQYNQPPPQQQQQQYYPPQQQQQQYAPQQQQIVQQQPMATQVYQQQPQQQVVYQQPAPVYQQQPVVHTQRIVQAGMPPPVYAAPAVTTTTYISNQPQVFVQPAVQYGTTTIVQQPTSTTYTYY